MAELCSVGWRWHAERGPWTFDGAGRRGELRRFHESLSCTRTLCGRRWIAPEAQVMMSALLFMHVHANVTEMCPMAMSDSPMTRERRRPKDDHSADSAGD